MKTFWLLLAIIATYTLFGCIMAWAEARQNDKPFKWETAVLWLPIVLGLER